MHKYATRMTIKAAVCLSIVIAPLPTHANDTGFYIREQQREACERDGGTYSYPNCSYPKAARDDRNSKSSGFWTVLGLAAGALVVCAMTDCAQSRKGETKEGAKK